MSRKVELALLAVVSVLIWARPAEGQVVLKPKGQNGALLRTKSIDANVSIEKQIATTTLTLTFRNTVQQRIEADFIYAVNPGTVVTHFAYWYGQEKVVARVVEKERAALIYSYITSRMRDPALIEMTGKNTFRARIFPVMPEADLKVEMVMVQTLPSDASGYSYSLPIKMEKGDPLDSLKVAVRVKPDAVIQRVGNNYGVSVVTDSDGYRLDINGEKVRPEKDLRIHVTLGQKPVQAQLYGARSGGPDGFFVLSLTSLRSIKNGKLTILGVKTYDVAPSGSIHAAGGKEFVIAGRYRGNGKAMALLSSDGKKTHIPVEFSKDAVANNPATKVWAARKIESLGSTKSHREEIIALSQRFTIPSKVTSWLAIPQEELVRYRQEKASADVELLGAQLLREYEKGRYQSSTSKSIRAKLVPLCKQTGRSMSSFMDQRLTVRVYRLVTPLVELITEGRGDSQQARSLTEKLNSICEPLDLDRESLIGQQRDQVVYNACYTCGQKFARAIIDHRENEPEARELLRRLTQLARLTHQKPTDYYLSWLSNDLYNMANEVVTIQKAGKGTPQRERELLAEISRIERAGQLPLGRALRDARVAYGTNQMVSPCSSLANELVEGRSDGPVARQNMAKLESLSKEYGIDWKPQLQNHMYGPMNSVVMPIINEILAGAGNSEKANKLNQRLAEMCRVAGVNYKEYFRNMVQGQVYQIGYELVTVRHRTILDRPRIASLEQKLEYAAKATGQSTRAFTDQFEGTYNRDPANALRDQIIQERRREAPSQAALNNLTQRFRIARLGGWNSGGYREYVDNQIERIAVEVELDKLQSAKPDPAIEARREELKKRDDELRARMGDPLIQVHAPEDALQVVALMPDGETKPLAFNPSSGMWEARFDIPGYAAEGDYVITVIIVDRNGARSLVTLNYHVNLRPPKANGIAASSNTDLALEVTAEGHIARVKALLPWGEDVRLERAGNDNRFSARVHIPDEYVGKPINVEYVVTDRAHNRTGFKVDTR